MQTATGAAATETLASPDEVARRGRELEELMEVVARAVEADGGEVGVSGSDLAAGLVEVSLSGACSACSLTSATLEQGITRVLHQRLSWVREVRTRVESAGDLAVAAAKGKGGFTPRPGISEESRP